MLFSIGRALPSAGTLPRPPGCTREGQCGKSSPKNFHRGLGPQKRLKRETVLAASPDIPVKIVYVPWLLPTWARAQVWGTVILVKRGVGLTEKLLAHELAHVLQWRLLGVFGFMYDYARFFLRHGYARHPLEMAARLAEQDEYFLHWAREILRAGRNQPEEQLNP